MILVATLAGCGRNETQVYQVAKESGQGQVPQGQAAGMMPPGHLDTGSRLPKLQWKLPAGWEEGSPGEMRAASFRVAGKDGKAADVSVIPLPGLAGGDLSNVNRWRGQVGQPAVTEDDLAKLAQGVEIAGQPAQLYDQAGENPGSGEKTRILAAIQRRDGVAWFFKMTGGDELVAQQRPAFVEFLKSLSFTAPPAQVELPPSHPPIDTSGMAAQAGDGPSAQAKPNWQVPAGWQETPGGQFLVAKFIVTGADKAQAAVNVSMSAGEGGGLTGNVNRWRRQIGLGELSEAEVNKLASATDMGGTKATFVDMAGTDAKTGQKTRLVGAMVPRPDQTWFYKLMGSESVVEREKDAFTRFVQSAKYP
jgi:hypothetical protein